MKKGKQRKVKSRKKEVDLISKLPDEHLIYIISLLPRTEGVRTSILSQRWKTLWKYSSHLSFDQRQMLKPLIEKYLQTSTPMMRLAMARCRKVAPEEFEEAFFDVISEAAMSISSIVDSHIGPLKYCSIRHLPESCASGDVVEWMKKLLEKEVMEVSMEVEPFDYDFHTIQMVLMKVGCTLVLPFEIFSKFKVIRLKNYRFTTTPFPNLPQVLKTLTLNNVDIELNNFQGILSHCSSLENLIIKHCDSLRDGVKIDSSSLKYFKICDMIVHKILITAVNVEVVEINSIICNRGELIFKTPNLHVLRAYNDVNKNAHYFSPYENKLLRTKNIVKSYDGILGCQGSTMASIFDKLVTLSLDLNSKNNSNSIALYMTLKSCHQLKNLEINIQVNLAFNRGIYDQNNNDCLPYSEDFFWKKREPCECIDHQLKSVCIKGYKGKEFEYVFLKYLITNGRVIEKIVIWFEDNSSWGNVATTMSLMSFPKLSPKLSIDLKPGLEYMRKDGGSFQKWVETLR